MLNSTTIENFDEYSNFQIDCLNRIVATSGLTNISDKLYHYNVKDIVFENEKVLGENIIVKRALCNIETFGIEIETIDFYITIHSNTIPENKIIICIPNSAFKIDDQFSLVHDSMVLFYYDNDNSILEGNNYKILLAKLDIFNSMLNSGYDKDGKEFYFKESQYKLNINGDIYHIVKKEDVLICES